MIVVLAASVLVVDAGPGGLRQQNETANMQREAQNETAVMTEDLDGLARAFIGNMTLSAEASAEAVAEAGKCSGRYLGAIEGLAPGCLGQCYSRGICGALSQAIGAYGSRKNKRAAKHAVCAHTGAFACLLEGHHRSTCGPVISQASRFGLPTSAGALYGRCR